MSSRRALAENLIFSALSAASNGLAFLLLIVAAHFLTTDEMGVLGTAFAFAAIGEPDRKSTRLNSSHSQQSRMPSSA